MSIFRTIIITFSIICFTASVLFIFNPQIVPVAIYKIFSSKVGKGASHLKPVAYTPVVEKRDMSSDEVYKYKNVSFSSPWKKTKEFTSINSKVVQFEGGRFVTMNNTFDSQNIYQSLLNEAKKQNKSAEVQNVFQSLGINNNRDIYEVMANLTEDDLTYFTPNDKVSIYMAILFSKNIYFQDADKILKYSLNGLIFYQYKPFLDKDAVDIIFFDQANNQYWITVSVPGSSQKEIDSVVNTLKLN